MIVLLCQCRPVLSTDLCKQAQCRLEGNPLFCSFCSGSVSSSQNQEVGEGGGGGGVQAFTYLGHECRDLLSQCNRMHVCTD